MSDPLMGNILDLPAIHEDGSFISAKISRVVEAIREYDPEIEVQWIPPRARTDRDPAFRIIHRPVGKPAYVAFVIQNEEDMNERVLAKIMANDQKNAGVNIQMSDLEAYDQAQQMVKRKRMEDAMAEANDMAYHILKSKKHNYRVNKNLEFTDYGPRII